MTSPRLSTVIEDYAEVLAIAAGDGLPLVIVGGQAVNIWAERYLDVEPQLTDFRPFTSKDLDVLGAERDLEEIARVTGAKKLKSLRKIFVPTVGVLEISRGGVVLKVEILKRIYGATTQDVLAGAVVLKRGALTLRLIDPFTLLETKIENAANLPQETRQDVKHVRMMIFCLRGLLREAVGQVAAGAMSGRQCVVALERTLQIIGSPSAKKLGAQHGIKWLAALPLQELAASKDAKLKNFSEKRLPRLFNRE